MRRTTGDWIACSLAGERYRAFVPRSLPPNPPIDLSADLLELMELANRALGRLDGIAEVLPATDLFLYQYVRKEALLSSQIEGTQSSFSDLLLFELDELPGVPLDDVREVSNYIGAVNLGLDRLHQDFPLSLRLLQDIHRALMASGRGSDRSPGEFRRIQVWIGGTRASNAHFVPPPPERLLECLDPFERFLHDMPVRTPVLIKAGLAHAQFETIHPFMDGNGRLGRLLITLLLCAEKVLARPILYLSLYFKLNRQEYYDRLQAIRTNGDWESWLAFFLRGVFASSREAVTTARSLIELFEHDSQRVETAGKAVGSALRLHLLFQRNPILTLPGAAERLKMTHSGVTNGMRQLEGLGIVREITGRRRNRLFVYDAYLNLLQEGVDSPAG